MGTNPKVAVIGAGSLSHGKRLIDDLLTIDGLAEGEMALMGNNASRLEVVGAYARRAAAALRPGLRITATDDLLRAIEGSEAVVALFDAGGYAAFDRDFRVVEGFGLDVCIGDTAGPLGALRALRNAPVMLSLAGSMRTACPGAVLVNYVNPMSPMVALAASRGVPCVGVCGGIEATRGYVAEVLGVPARDLSTTFAGVNHLCWLLGIEGPGGDLYDRFRELMRDPEVRGDEAARFELLQHFGFFVTESSGHVTDFFPYFRRTAEERRRYCSGPGYSGASGAYRKYTAFAQRRIGNADYLAGLEPSTVRSSDYGAEIVEAWIGGGSRSVYGNVMNSLGGGAPALPALPREACVELSVEVGERGVGVAGVPSLPPALAALCSSLALQHGLVVEAALSEDPEALFAAVAQDPLTAATLDLPSIRDLVSRLVAANAAWLAPGFARPLRATEDAGERPSRRRRGADDALLALVKDYEGRRRRAAGPGPNPGS